MLSGTPTWRRIVESRGDEREILLRRLVESMPLRSKIRQMSGDMGLLGLLVTLVRYNYFPFPSGRDRRLGIPPFRFTDGPRGIALDRSTCFPVSIARGASWDPELEERIGEAMGIEARARGADMVGAVCINLLRHPGWGRAQETYGEDPFLLGEMGAALVRGLQKHVMACVKHYACNSIEKSRFHVDVRVDERTLREVYLPHFHRCVREGAAAVMSAYNRVNGEYCSHNTLLLRRILKGEWGFKGMVISDFFLGTRNAVKAARGGLDVEMPFRRHFGRKLLRAVRRGEVPEKLIDEAVIRILRQKARFQRPEDPSLYHPGKTACRGHRGLALEAARKSIVLLSNREGVLPLRKEDIRRLAVLGPLADKPNLGDYGSSRVRPPYAVTPLQGIREKATPATEILHVHGVDPAEARKAARRADAVVIVVGLTARQEGEYIPPAGPGGDREDLRLRRGDEELILAAAEENERCIVVLEGGSAIVTEAWRERVPALLMAWYPGMEGGRALAEILFGEVNPGGKLPVTFPGNQDHLPPFDPRARRVEYGYFHGYRLLDKEGREAAFPFGFGLSYTTFRYSDLHLDAKNLSPGRVLTVNFRVTNTGGREGDEVAQLYISCPGREAERPPKELKGFRRLHLKAGESREVSFSLSPEDLAFFHPERGEWALEEGEYRVMAGSSSRTEDLVLTDTFTLSLP